MLPSPSANSMRQERYQGPRRERKHFPSSSTRFLDRWQDRQSRTVCRPHRYPQSSGRYPLALIADVLRASGSASGPARNGWPLVGRSGSSKSTLANLIPRFYHHSEGQIPIDGIDVENSG